MSPNPRLDDILEHHGVKGMRWGVRKDRRGGGKASQDHLDVAALRRKGLHQLSNKELKNLNERLNLEQNYNRLTVNKGQSFVQGFLKSSGVKNALYSAAGSALIAGGTAALTAAGLVIRKRFTGGQ